MMLAKAEKTVSPCRHSVCNEMVSYVTISPQTTRPMKNYVTTRTWNKNPLTVNQLLSTHGSGYTGPQQTDRQTSRNAPDTFRGMCHNKDRR